MGKTKRRAIISVSDKTGVVDFARGLEALGFKIYSTGGTLALLKEEGIKAKNITKITAFPEIFDGRVKTLNPFVHGGILFRRDHPEDVRVAKELGIKPIDLLCVNLYPFKATIERTDNFDEIIENIDIGGPAMVRSAAKNFKDVLIVTSQHDYPEVLRRLEEGSDSYEYRRSLMIKAYEHTAAYDAMIANYMNSRFTEGFGGAKYFVSGQKVMGLRYGENPHQQGSLYQFDDFWTRNFRVKKGEASFNNLTDMSAAVKIAASFPGRPGVAIIKHGNPCGFALRGSLLESYSSALACDPVSAYGGVVAVNGVVDEELARKINETFIEVLVAPKVTDEAMAIFEAKKRMKIFELGSGDELPVAHDMVDFKHIMGGFVLQNEDRVREEEVIEAKLVTKRDADPREKLDLEIAWKIAALTKSNCVVYVKDGAMVAIGMGMTSRVDAARCAIKKAQEFGHDLRGAVLASEAFFPFRDSIDSARDAGITAIIQPGGSIRDDEVIAAADEAGMAMLLTGVRHFLH